MGRLLYKIVRKFMEPINPESAQKTRRTLSLIYVIVAWHAFGLVMWQFYKGKGDWAKTYGLKTEEEDNVPKAVQFAQILGVRNAKVSRISGFSVKEEYEIKDGLKVEKVKEGAS